MNKTKISAILNQELGLATGCTEPAAIALAAACAAAHLKEEVLEIHVTASSNILKNAMAAGIPGTPYTGVPYAAAIGAVGGNSEKMLQVIEMVSKEAYEKAENLVETGAVRVKASDTEEKLYIDIVLKGAANTARVVISGAHTNIIRIEENNKVVFENTKAASDSQEISSEEIQNSLSVDSIFDYITQIELEEIPDIVLKSIEKNSAVAEEGLKNDYGLKVGKLTKEFMDEGMIAKDLSSYTAMITSAAADARMAGAPLPVITNSGSGNQGITATMAVVAAADFLKSSQDKMLRAVTLSHLMAIHIHAKFGKLSVLCGATVAGTGAACGITYLLGGGRKEIGYTVQSMIGDVAGMLCDGAKADCALKINTCIHAAVQTALMASKGIYVKETDGIVTGNVEKTIENFTTLSNQCSKTIDKLVLRMMLDK